MATTANNQRPAPPARPSNPPAPKFVRPAPARPVVIQRAEEMEEIPPADLPIRRMRSQIIALRSPQVNERGFFFRRTYSTKEIVDTLFRAFLGLGVSYDLGTSVSAAVLGNAPGTRGLRRGERMRDAFGGNCIALANAFATVLDEADIRAAAVEVRRQEQGRAFVVHCPRFIDPEVRGHIYQGDALWAFHYLFSNHTAVWVPELKLYYDPMAGTTYRNLSEAIVMELESLDRDENVWKGRYLGREYTLTRRPREARPSPGNFFKYDMEAVAVGFAATPLGAFKVAT